MDSMALKSAHTQIFKNTIYFGDVAVADELPEEVPQSNEDEKQNTEELIEEEIYILNEISEANI